jgi:serine/threonine-protein kinase
MKTAIGTHIGRYQIDAEIGRGAMGLVYQAHDPKIDRPVAIKTISLSTQEIEEEKEFRERFFIEAKAAGRLSHPGIVTIFDVGEEPETHEPYIVMEFVAGQALNKILAGSNRRLALGPALQITQEIAEALNYAHAQGVIHRDIKPANILITLDGHVKIADFGIAKLNQGLMTIPGQVLGSPAYMAPEQLSGENADARSDLFSVGVILYSMLTGFRPFQGNSAATVSFKVVNRDPLPVTSFDSEFPAELDRLVSRSIAKDPEQRYQTGMEMAQDIQRIRERHELMNQTASALTIITSPVDETGGSKAPTPRPSAIPRPPSPVEIPEPHKNPTKASGPVKPIAKIAAKGAKLKSALIPKELALTAAGVLFLAIAFISFEVMHTKKPKSIAIPPANTAGASLPVNASTQNPPNVPAETVAPLEDTNIATLTENIEPPIRHAPRRKVKAVTKPKTSLVAKASPPAFSQTVPQPPMSVTSGLPGKIPASLQNVKATVVQPFATATLELKIEYQFEEAEASIWSDNQLIYSQKLFGESKKRALLFKKVEGREQSTVKIPAGEHHIHVRIQSDAEQYDQSQTITGNFAASSKSTLSITCDKRGHDHELQLTLQ